eukprot:1401837-Amphidinium_carterae.1
MALTSRINGYIDKAEEILNSLFGKSMPAGTERIQELEVHMLASGSFVPLGLGRHSFQGPSIISSYDTLSEAILVTMSCLH